MIKSSSNKLAVLIENHIIYSTDKKEVRRQIARDIADLVGDPNPNRINGIINGTYEMKLMDVIATMKYFKLEDISEVIEVKIGSHKTFAALQKKLIAA